MMYAVKGNTQLKIDEAERSEYLKLGYDIAVVNGDALEIIEVSPAKTIPYKDHEALKAQLTVLEDENTKLKAELAEAKKAAKADK
ncbi:hypothetical protein J7E73_02320 [Paenibacillus albidus]|uniref:hypothetical protein n=1 Tax=Paenibacillus albidus TaxID=2041023 RepID=UPI001BE95786|nr:hypothetical protein [Paenibacillus albidus]MBT2287981.1 hypothetical protein [Paenibacillus albidus]